MGHYFLELTLGQPGGAEAYSWNTTPPCIIKQCAHDCRRFPLSVSLIFIFADRAIKQGWIPRWLGRMQQVLIAPQLQLQVSCFLSAPTLCVGMSQNGDKDFVDSPPSHIRVSHFRFN